MKTNEYIEYDKIQIIDGNNKEYNVVEPKTCMIKCENEPNCIGTSICIKKTDKNKLKVLCEDINNISTMNTQNEDKNCKTFIKKKEMFEKNTIYIIKINGKYLTIKNNRLTTSSKIKDAEQVLINGKKIIFKKLHDSCLYAHDSYVYIIKCNDFDKQQEFVYDDINKTLRLYNDTKYCIIAEDGNIMIREYNEIYKNNIIIENYIDNENFELEQQITKTNNIIYVIYFVLLIIIYIIVK